jgi:hypothetical protein
MFPLFLLGIALLIGFYFLAHAFVNADPKSLAKAVRYTTIGVTVIVVVFLAVTGRLGVAVAIGAFVFPLVLRWRALMGRVRAARGPSEGQSSTIETMFLRMWLDHDRFGAGRSDGPAGRMPAGRFPVGFRSGGLHRPHPAGRLALRRRQWRGKG